MTRLLDRAAALANHGLFFEVHELLEPVWFRATEPARTALQGLIQVAVGFHHLENGNREGARSLLVLGLAKMADAGAVLPLDLPRVARRAASGARRARRRGEPGARSPLAAPACRCRERAAGVDARRPMALLLNEAEVTMLLPMTLALEAVEEAFRWPGRGEARRTSRASACRCRGASST